jgi:prepilin signal peptidase PulO-like enzyme (type II secretory pathway)
MSSKRRTAVLGTLGFAAIVWQMSMAGATLSSPLPTFAGFVLMTLLATSAVADATTYRIPNDLTLPALGAAALLNLAGVTVLPDAGANWGAIGPAGFTYGVLLTGLPFFLAFKSGGCGGGDVKLAAAVGGLLGPMPALNALVWAVLLAAIVVGARLMWRRACNGGWVGVSDLRWPLAPFLGAGTIVSLMI